MCSGVGAEYPGIRGCAQKCRSIMLTTSSRCSAGQNVRHLFVVSSSVSGSSSVAGPEGWIVKGVGIWMVSLVELAECTTAPDESGWPLANVGLPMLSPASMADNMLTPPAPMVWTISECVKCEMGIRILMEFGSSLVSAVVFALVPCSHISPGTPPLVSFGSVRPVGLKSMLMNVCSQLARWGLYGVVGKFPFSRLLMASRWCHQHSWCLASGQTRRLALISARSLSVWTNRGSMPYFSRKTVAHACSALVHFPCSTDVAVVKRQ